MFCAGQLTDKLPVPLYLSIKGKNKVLLWATKTHSRHGTLFAPQNYLIILVLSCGYRVELIREVNDHNWTYAQHIVS